jgi:pantothenate kinase
MIILKMQKNIGVVNDIHPDGNTDDGLERKNPLIVALGDSVTAGHEVYARLLMRLIKAAVKKTCKQLD